MRLGGEHLAGRPAWRRPETAVFLVDWDAEDDAVDVGEAVLVDVPECAVAHGLFCVAHFAGGTRHLAHTDVGIVHPAVGIAFDNGVDQV